MAFEPEKKGMEKPYEMVNHPTHYNRYPIEAVEMARRIWGDEAMYTAAQITAFFYRMRLGLKPENSVEQELSKEDFWLNYAKMIEEDLYSKRHNLVDEDRLLKKLAEIKQG